MGRKVMQRFYDDKGNLISKECDECHEIKPVSEFNKCKSKTDGLQTKCKECLKKYRQDSAKYRKEYQKQYQKDNAERLKEYHKQYQKDNVEKIKEYQKQYQKQYQKDNAEAIKEYKKQYQRDNAEAIKEYQKQYQKENAEYFKEYQKQYQKQYQKDNAEYFKEYLKEYYQEKTQEALQQIKIEVEANPEKYDYTEGKDICGIIYLVYNTESNKYYVGQTTIGFDNRYSKGWLYEHSKKDTVKHDLELYGENSFKYIKIFKVAYSQYELDKLEAYYINYYNSYENGYNENRGNIFTDRGKEK